MAAAAAGSNMSGFMGEPPRIRAATKVHALPQADDDPGSYDLLADGGFSLRRTVHPVRRLLVVALVLVVLDTLCSLAIPLLIRRGVDHGITQGAMSGAVSGLALLVVGIDYLIQRLADRRRRPGRPDGALPAAAPRVRRTADSTTTSANWPAGS